MASSVLESPDIFFDRSNGVIRSNVPTTLTPIEVVLAAPDFDLRSQELPKVLAKLHELLKHSFDADVQGHLTDRLKQPLVTH